MGLRVFAPYRIDMGGTWDIKALALPYHAFAPVTVNMALTKGVYVTLSATRDPDITISSPYYGVSKRDPQFPSLLGPLGLYFMAARFFHVKALKIEIEPELPPGTALGGSSSALIALVFALDQLCQTHMDHERLAHIAYHMEDIHQEGAAGMQDHLAALYGGVNLWKWDYTSYPYFQREDLDQEAMGELSKCILIAYTGESHSSSDINKKWVSQFLAGVTTRAWIEANEITMEFWNALKRGDYSRALQLIQKEMEVRKAITPEAFEARGMVELFQCARDHGCGARFAGAGAGGCVWALGEEKDIKKLKEAWGNILAKTGSGFLVDASPTKEGVRIIGTQQGLNEGIYRPRAPDIHEGRWQNP